MTTPRKPGMTAERFRELLAAAGLSQAEAARRLGYSKQQVHRWHRGTHPIPRAAAALIRQVLRPAKK